MSAALWHHFQEPETVVRAFPAKARDLPTHGLPLAVAAVRRLPGATATQVASLTLLSAVRAQHLLLAARREGVLTRTRIRGAYAYTVRSS